MVKEYYHIYLQYASKKEIGQENYKIKDKKFCILLQQTGGVCIIKGTLARLILAGKPGEGQDKIR